LVIVKASSAVTGAPVDGTTYTANTNFGSATNGTGFAAGEKTVYANTGTSVSITNLTANTIYHVAIFEYNNASKCYLSTSPETFSFSTASNLSDVITAGGESANVSSIINDAAPLTSSDGVQVWQITIRDGGAAMNDNDNLPTIVNNITFSQGSGNAVNTWNDAIESVALFDGTTHIGTATVTATQIQFTGLNLTVADNSSKTLSLRLSVKCPIGNPSQNLDGDDFQFQLSNANITTTGNSSTFTNFTAINSTNDQNVLAVVATELRFGNQPSTTGTNAPMSSVTVRTTDACGNIDRDYTGTVNITSTGTLSGSSTNDVALVNGVATFTNIIHTTEEYNLTLEATLAPFSPVTSGTFDILESTTFEPGDFAIVAVNTARNASGSADEVCFVTFRNINPGTAFEITDNGYERLYPGQWGNTEGTMRFTRGISASTVQAGEVICIIGPDEIYDGDGIDRYDIYVCGVKDDANWVHTILSGNTVGLDWNSDDQVWIMQGGTWNNNTTNGHDATYTGGNVLYGWTAIGWEENPGYSSTSGSTLYPNSDCFSTDINTSASKVKYTGAMTTATKYGWLARINDNTNWTAYANNADYNAGGLNYVGSDCSSTGFPISVSTETEGKWTGDGGTDWFDCGNWETLIVPDASTAVTIEESASNNCVVGGGLTAEALSVSITSATNTNNLLMIEDTSSLVITNDLIIQKTGGTGELSVSVTQASDLTCGNLTIQGTAAGSENAKLISELSTNTITVNGNLTIELGGKLDLEGTNPEHGLLVLNGDWINNETDIASNHGFDQGEGEVVFSGSTDQQITTDGFEQKFAFLTINKPSGNVILNSNIEIEKTLDLTDGVISTGSNVVEVSFTAATDIINASNISFINGNLIRHIASNTDTYVLPVGYGGTATTNYYRADFVNNNLVGPTFLNVSVSGIVESGNNVDANLGEDAYQDGTKITNIKENAIWSIEPNIAPTSGDYGINLYTANIGGLVDNEFTILKRANGSTDYADWSTFENTTTIPASDSPGRTVASGYAQRTGFTDFSEFGVGDGNHPLPIELLTFEGNKKENYNELRWVTATEINNEKFEIERSENAKDFYKIDEMVGAGNSSFELNYRYNDYTAKPYMNCYYRLKQIDFDQSFSYSKIIKLSADIKSNESISITKNTESLVLKTNEHTIVKIYNAFGQLLVEKHSNGDTEIFYDELGASSGIYFVQIINDNQTQTIKVNF
jgi:hypothetical protein